MHYKKTLVIILVFLNLTTFSQKDLDKVELEVSILASNNEYSTGYNDSLTFYIGKPKKLDFEGTIYFNPGNSLYEVEQKSKKQLLIRDRTTMPATRYYFKKSNFKKYPFKESYLNPFSKQEKKTKKDWIQGFLDRNVILEEEIIDGELYTYQLERKEIEKIYQPFYFKKYEVTNQEYWEFLNDINSDKNVAFKDLEYTFEENEKTVTIPIYPDTACWTKDVDYSYNEPYTRNYFWHIAFDSYPVVGINYLQAKAFCHWKTKQLQASLGKKHKHLKLKVDLPSEIEWEWMAIMEKGKTYGIPITILSDNDWMLDLVLCQKQNSKKELNAELFSSRSNKNYSVIDGSMYTHPADLENKENMKQMLKFKKKAPNEPNYLNELNINGVSCMSGNVSEWLRETYSENWELMFQRQLKIWEQKNTTASLLIRQIALFHDSFADKDGQLVKGGNWMDERFSDIYGKNKAGIHAKTFVSPTKSHSTLGFRYVIYFME